MLVIGLTGSLGTGKTTVARMFLKLGARVIGADAIVHQLMRPKGKAFRPIVRRFGQEVLTANAIDRKKLSQIVFNDAKQLDKLCRIIHPLVAQQIKNTIHQLQDGPAKPMVVIDVPLLIEAGFNRWVDYVIVVKTSRRLQIERVIRRQDLSRAEAVKRIKAQVPLQEKIRLADMIIDNGGTLTQTQKQVKVIWQRLLRENQ